MTRNGRLFKATLACVVWLLLHIPLDLILSRQAHSDTVAFVIGVQVLDIVVLFYLFLQITEYKLHRPWKCVVCDGFGKRHFTPGMSDLAAATSMVCAACAGSGVIWESAKK
jgi:hypothetical protein